MLNKKRGDHMVETHYHEASAREDCTLIKAKSRYETPQTNKKQRDHQTSEANKHGRANRVGASGARPDRARARPRAGPELGHGPSSQRLGLVRLFSSRMS